MDEIKYLNTIGHYVLSFIIIVQLRSVIKLLRKIKNKPDEKLPKVQLNERTALDVFNSTYKG